MLDSHAQPEEDIQDIDEAGAPDEEGGPAKTARRTKGGPRKKGFRASAVNNLQRARRSVGSGEEITPKAQFLVQSATAYALLELADAVRSLNGSGESQPEASVSAVATASEAPGREQLGPISNYLDLLGRLHAHLRPRTYVEIGIGQGRSLARARPETLSVGVDPRPKLSNPDPSKKIFELTSDDFFSQHDLRDVLDGQPVDFAFIDGLHAFEFALRDFRNLEKFCASDSTIVMHDCYPKDNEAALREDSKAFHRGVWKLILCLREYRPDLRVVVAEVPPTGLGIVTHLDPASRVLEERYDEIRERFADVGYDQVAHSKREKLNLVPADWNTVEAILAERPSRGGSA